MPFSIAAAIDAVAGNLRALFLRHNYLIERLFLIEEYLQMRVSLSKGIGNPGRLELVITSKFRNLHIIAPATVRTTMFCNVRGNDRSGAPGESVIVSPVVR